MATHYQPVIQVGGDIYDWLRLPDGRLFFWIADATGHGASAALLTALAKLLFRHAAAEAASPAEILRAVQRGFPRDVQGPLAAHRDGRRARPRHGPADDGRRGASAAARPARRRPARVLPVSQCPPLGLAADLAPVEDIISLRTGDGSLLFTDGLYDAINPAGERMALDAFEECARLASAEEPRPLDTGSASNFLEQLLARLKSYSDGQAFSDDLAAVAFFRLAP